MQRLLSRSRFTTGAVSLCATLALFVSPVRADVPAPGYQLASQPSPAPFAATCTLPGGDIVTFDGLSVDRWTAGGAFVGTLATLPGFTFSSFVIATPDGSAVVFGENSNGDLFIAQSDGSGYAPLVNLTFNYRAAWLPGGDLLVSAATGGFGNGNDLVRVALNPPGATFIGHVAGPSGPVAVAADGALYYATQSDIFPTPPGSTDVIRWSAATVQLGNLSAGNAQTVGAGFDGGSALAIDPVGGGVYLGDSNFGLSQYKVRLVGSNPANSPIVVDQGANFIGNFEFVPGGGPGSFAAWQPHNGVNLKYNAGFDQFTVRPLRAVLAVSGPGTTGPGIVTFSVTGGVPNGSMFATACPLPFVNPFETAHQLPTFLWVTAFTLANTRRASTPVPLDANGTGTFQIFNQGNLQGLMAWQFLVGNSSGVFVASTTTVTF
jgi:hypothetical protein